MGVAAFFFILPISKSFIYIKSLFIACIIPVIMGVFIFLHVDYMYSGQTFLKLVPFIISLALFIYVLIRIWNDNLPKDTKVTHIAVIVVLAFCTVWSGIIAWFALDNCFMGACA